MPLMDLEKLRFGRDHQAEQRTSPLPARRIVRLDRRHRPAEAAIDELLSSALLASDYELDQILHEVDKISRALKLDAPDSKTLEIAQHPAVWRAVRQTLLERELRHLALTDDLTCFYNRRGFFAVATQLLKLAHRKGQPLLLFFCDLDDLKKINDSFGHEAGDLALVRAADALEQTFRDADLLARIGGDEFVVVSLEASRRVEGMVLRRLEKNLRKVGASEKRYKLTLSVGVAQFDPKCPVSLGELMSHADQAMYQQKRRRLVAGVVGQTQIDLAEHRKKPLGNITES